MKIHLRRTEINQTSEHSTSWTSDSAGTDSGLGAGGFGGRIIDGVTTDGGRNGISMMSSERAIDGGGGIGSFVDVVKRCSKRFEHNCRRDFFDSFVSSYASLKIGNS